MWKMKLKMGTNKIKSLAWARVSEHFCFKSRTSAGVYKLNKRLYKRDRCNFTRKNAVLA
jgi:hypothetical protein